MRRFAKRGVVLVATALLIQPVAEPSAQQAVPPVMPSLIAALRPALPYPDAAAAGDVPADQSASPKWFVVWPAAPEETRITVRANPLNPDVQKAGADAMARINRAVAVAERKAQASYDRALEELRRTGSGATLDTITLEDEGVEGERIDAEFELTIDLEPAASFELASSVPPEVVAGSRGAAWTVSTAANVYRESAAATARERFRAAEARLYFGLTTAPRVSRRKDEPQFAVTVANAPTAFAIVIRGNEALVRDLVDRVDWSALAPVKP